MMLAILNSQIRRAILFQNQVDWLDDEAAIFWGSWGIIVDFLLHRLYLFNPVLLAEYMHLLLRPDRQQGEALEMKFGEGGG